MKTIYGRRVFKNKHKKFVAWFVFIAASVYTILALNTVTFTDRVEVVKSNLEGDVLQKIREVSVTISSAQVKSSNESSLKHDLKTKKKIKHKSSKRVKKVSKTKMILINTKYGAMPFSSIGSLPISEAEVKAISKYFIMDEFVNKTQSYSSVDDKTKLYYNKTRRNLEKLIGKPECPKVSPKLRGTFNRTVDDYKPPSLLETAKANPSIILGGRYIPPCIPRNKVAIIIPLRGRDLQLKVLLAHLHPILQRQQIDYTIYTISQEDNGLLFNKAKLMNSGFLEASKYDQYDCFVFHDVDMLVENDECLYTCPDNKNPRLLTAHVDKFDYEYNTYYPHCSPFSFPSNAEVHYVGGVIMMTPKHMYDFNGYSGLYWGWGGEDDDMFYRAWQRGCKFENPFEKKCSFHMIKHETETENKENYARYALLSHAISRMRFEGLSTLRYKVLSVKKEPLYTNITMRVGLPTKKLMDFMLETPNNWLMRCHRLMPWEYEDIKNSSQPV